MKKSYPTNLYLALTHYPVINKNGDTIASAVTNLDLHDIARAAKTYGVRSFYVVTPLADQQELVDRIVDHWVKGIGSTYNPKRREALELIRINNSLDDVIAHIRSRWGDSPKDSEEIPTWTYEEFDNPEWKPMELPDDAFPITKWLEQGCDDNLRQ